MELQGPHVQSPFSTSAMLWYWLSSSVTPAPLEGARVVEHDAPTEASGAPTQHAPASPTTSCFLEVSNNQQLVTADADTLAIIVE